MGNVVRYFLPVVPTGDVCDSLSFIFISSIWPHNIVLQEHVPVSSEHTPA